MLAILAGFLALRTPDTDRDEMIARYSGSAGAFVAGPAGQRIHYRDQGERGRRAIILLHGSNSSLQTWEPLVKRLGGTWRIVTLDLPGHGLTGGTPDKDYSAAGMIAAVDVVAAKLGLDHFVLGGNSMGGWVAWRYALAEPERVDALLLLDASGMPLRKGEKAPPSNIGFRVLEYPFGRWLATQITPRSLVEESLRGSVAKRAIVDDAMIDRYWELLRFPGNREATVLRARMDREPAMAARVGEIEAPTLILFGDKDRLINPSAAKTFNERIAGVGGRRCCPVSVICRWKKRPTRPRRRLPASLRGGLRLLRRLVQKRADPRCDSGGVGEGEQMRPRHRFEQRAVDLVGQHLAIAGGHHAILFARQHQRREILQARQEADARPARHRRALVRDAERGRGLDLEPAREHVVVEQGRPADPRRAHDRRRRHQNQAADAARKLDRDLLRQRAAPAEAGDVDDCVAEAVGDFHHHRRDRRRGRREAARRASRRPRACRASIPRARATARAAALRRRYRRRCRSGTAGACRRRLRASAQRAATGHRHARCWWPGGR